MLSFIIIIIFLYILIWNLTYREGFDINAINSMNAQVSSSIADLGKRISALEIKLAHQKAKISGKQSKASSANKAAMDKLKSYG